MIPPGVTFLDHTADLGMDVEAPSLDALLHRAALGMLALLRGEEDEEGEGEEGREGEEGPEADGAPVVLATPLEIRADSAAGLLAAWLRELLFLHEVERRDYVGHDGGAAAGRWGFAGVVRTRAGGHAVREIKGVTWHGLEAREREGVWRARVIFDV